MCVRVYVRVSATLWALCVSDCPSSVVQIFTNFVQSALVLLNHFALKVSCNNVFQCLPMLKLKLNLPVDIMVPCKQSINLQMKVAGHSRVTFIRAMVYGSDGQPMGDVLGVRGLSI